MPGQGGDLSYNEATDGGASLGTVNPPGELNPWHGAWNVGSGDYSYDSGAPHRGAAYHNGAIAPGAALGAVNPVNPWRGAWNVGEGQGNGFWGPVDAAGAVVGAATAPLSGADNNCQHLQPTYDRSSNYIGQRWVNACY